MNYRTCFLDSLRGLVGGVTGIGLMGWLAHASHLPLLMAPFGATCVLLFAAPDAPLAQPRNVVIGHLVSAAVGLLVYHWLGDGVTAMALGVGLAIMAMQLMGVVHPPAGANPLVIMMAPQVPGVDFLLTPVASGAVVLVVVAWVINNPGRARRWPVYWWRA
ncbi:HPP family protein [Larsenimonas rhizosphaerae]|uniref:HPP family protein n=1 Tax=Larsenimonas rhizosphaerae TaxID=2944682 RepID=UPI00203472BD|nr:HPP family protein [Larsenimonas rhizosphaerae]MCM2129369.1 HPP family protein [Larsenimonas rhizosphaerae]